ncbi:MAG: AMP-binding protein [Eubacteriales bacterium]|nr:AMP-binding protein [Eubacteriales bacterium]
MQTIDGEQYFEVRDFKTIPEMLSQSVALFSDMTAVRYRLTPTSEPVSISYKQLAEDVNNLLNFLRSLNSQPLRIAVVGENSYHWILAYLAAVSGAGLIIPLDRMLPPEEIKQLLTRSEANVVFYDAAFFQVFSDDFDSENRLPPTRVCMRSGRLKQEEQQQLQTLINDDNGKTNHLDLDQVLSSLWPVAEATLPAIDPNALMALLFTSGTTSNSKGVMLSQTNVCADIKGIAGMVQLKPGIRMLSILPLHHTFENTCGLLMALYVGASINICDGLRYIQKNMQEYEIEMIIGVPAVFENFHQKIMDTLRKKGKEKLIRRLRGPVRGLRKIGIDLRRKLFKQILDAFGGALYLGICGAAPIDPEIISFFDDIGVRILQGYGLTETSPVVAGCNSKIFVPGTVGRPVSNMTVAIDSDNPGEPGEILVRGPIVMLGYYQDDLATEETIDKDGWFHTGDIGVLNPRNRCISITGRKKSMIVLKSGKKVFPEEVEYLFNQFDFIRESLVWGDQDEKGDVVVSAKFVLDEHTLAEKHGLKPEDHGVQKLIDQMIRDVNAKMPSFKSIKQHVFSFQDMVKTTTLKIKRQIEIDKLKELMNKQKLRWRELTGKNLDSLAKEDSSGQKSESQNDKGTKNSEAGVQDDKKD